MLALTALFCMAATVVSAQNRTVTGTVVGPDNLPVVGATVFATDGQKVNVPLAGTTTDANGRYSLSIPANARAISAQFIGYEQQTISLGGGRNVYDFSLKDSSVMMEEVVAIGYAKVKRKDVTGSTVSVSGQELAAVPVMTAAQALQGKAAGVNIISTSGAPGASSQISIRGGSSITGSTKPLYIVDGFEMGDALENVDINDIETIDVLKDASATAIYGSRGSNGIILITTKSAQKGKTQVSYNTYFSFDTLANSIDMVSDVEDYVKYQYELMALNNKRPSYAAVFDDGLAADSPEFGPGVYSRIAQRYGNARGIDWQEQVFGGYALTQSHNVNIMTGTDKTQVMLSYNYNGQDGLSVAQGAYKNTIRAKVQSELWKGVRLDLNTSFNNKKVEGAGLGLRNVLMSPLHGGTMFSEDHLLNQQTLLDYRAYDDAFGALNPIVQSLSTESVKRSRSFNVNAGLEFDFLKYFTWRTAGSYSWNNSKNKSFSDKNSTDYLTDPENTGIKGSISNSESYSYQITNTLSYNQTFNEKHKLGILLGQETRYSESEGNSLSLKKFPDPNFGLDDISNAEVSEKKTSHSRSGMVSLFARVNYSFDDRYLLTATVRGDGSSKFMTGHKWGVFPAVSAAWRISEENFWKDHKVADVINGLKLRVGYGTTGNNSIDSYSYSTSLKPSSYPMLDNENHPVFLPEETLGNPKLRWETVITSNVGLELSMFNNRLNITAEWYNNQSNDLLLKCKIPDATGYKQQYRNVGKMRNRGWEVTLNTINIQKKNFRWTSDLNLTFNRSKVISLNDDQEEMTFSQGSNRSGTVTYYATVGQRLGDMYGYKYDGIYTTDDFIELANGTLIVRDGVVRPSTGTVQPGDMKFAADSYDENGNPVFSRGKMTKIGNGAPLCVGGFNNTFTFYGVDLSVFMKFSIGNDIYNATRHSMSPYASFETPLTEFGTNFYRMIDPVTGDRAASLARLRELNPDEGARTWSLSSANRDKITYPSSYFVEDGSYLRIAQLTVGYTFPRSWMQKARINKARIYFTVNNLATITGYSGIDPEIPAAESNDNVVIKPGYDSSTYPRARSYVVGLNLTF